MSKTVRILGIAGGLGRESYDCAVLRAATQCQPEDATIDIFEIDEIPIFNDGDLQEPPTTVVELKDRIRAADAILFVTPEYNYSIPAVLQNAIDWLARVSADNPWSGKSAAVMGASTSALGTTRAQVNLWQMMVALDMFPLNQPEVMIGAANERFDTVGELTEEQTTEYVGVLVQNLVDWTQRVSKKESLVFHQHQESHNHEMLFAFN